MDTARLSHFVSGLWDDEIVPQLVEYIRIPNKSPMFDAKWVEHGYMDAAVKLMESWARSKLSQLPGATLEVIRLEGRTPLIYIDVPGEGDDTVMLYGHLDKQPEMTGWAEGLGPWTPVIKGDRLYGRGGADDGYAIFGSLAALLALREQGVPHARCVVMIEACEESGSYDLPYYVDHLALRIGSPSLVVCLDSGCGNYDQLWLTTSLRGMTGGNLTVQVLEEGVHSGDASGVVPSSFRILRELLTRLEDPATGQIKPKELYVEIPEQRVAQAKLSAEVLGADIYDKFPWVEGMQPVTHDLAELVLNRTWRPQLAVTGVGGMPSLDSAGKRPAVRCQGYVCPGKGWQRLERAAVVAVAGAGSGRCLGALFWCAAHLYGRRRQHSVHGHAGREVSAGAVPDHRRAWPALERARSERIPAHSHRQEGHHGGRRSGGAAPPAGRKGLKSTASA
jgi:acetylornithine deacetylase/succinyl-diaminopimelate desuccinylase-like protein